MRWLAPLLAALLLLLVSDCLQVRPASADEGWVITTFNAQVDVQRDGVLQITETILVDFGRQRKHGIYRDIPVRYDYDDKRNRVYDFGVDSVTNVEGQRLKYEVIDTGGIKRIKIGDPDREVSGPQSYRITYRLGHVLNPFEGHDELYLNIIGPPGWPVRVEKAAATVTLPADGIQEVTCFQGATTSTEPCRFSHQPRAAAFETTRTLPERENFTIVVSLAKGVVTEPTLKLQNKPRQFADYFEVNPFTVGAALLALAGIVSAIVAAYWSFGRDRRYTSIYYLTDNPAEETPPLFANDPIVVEFQPPDGLRPAQIGLLLDEKADTLDVTATIVDLAVRGYLRITEVQKDNFVSRLFGAKDWQLDRTDKDESGLLPYEVTVLNGLFADGPSVKLSDLKNEFYTYLQSAEKQLYHDAMKRSWFPFRPDWARAVWFGLGVVVIALGIGVIMGLGWLLGAGIVGFPIILGGLLLFALSHNMPRRTALGRELLRRALGFRMYIATAEKDRQKFNEQQNLFSEYLPYAIVFRCVDKWARAFRDIDMTKEVRSWYSGSGPFYAASFSNNLQGFASSVSSTIQSTPGSSGSSGLGGGGSSGGGGGGGGGGSW
jgi:uncharacterized membrane protein YgcG